MARRFQFCPRTGSGILPLGGRILTTWVRVAGELDRWPAKLEMVEILRSAGMDVTVGRYSIRINDCEHFVLQEYGGDWGDPCIDADSDSLDLMLRDASLVSRALASADIRHRFELYDETDDPVGYIHHKWPKQPDAH